MVHQFWLRQHGPGACLSIQTLIPVDATAISVQKLVNHYTCKLVYQSECAHWRRARRCPSVRRIHRQSGAAPV